MRAKTYSWSPVTTSATGLASGVTLATSATLAATTIDGLAHLITVTGIAATNHSGKTITITGTDADGKALSEGIAGPNGAVAVTTTKYFKTVTSVVASATCGADTFNIGWTVGAIGPTIPLDWKQNPFVTTLAVDISGTINYSLAYCVQDSQNSTSFPYPSMDCTWTTNAAPMSGATADQVSTYVAPVTATRFVLTSVTNGATVKFTVINPVAS